MTTLTVTRAAALPRVNLLPPEIEQAEQLARLKKVLAVIVVGALVLAGLLYFWASGQVSSAQSELEAAQAENAALQAEAAQYAEVPLVAQQVATAETNLATAMAPEVRVSFLMNDLSLTIPQSVRLTTMSIVVAPSDPAAAAAAAATGVPYIPPTGTVTYTGKAVSYDAVASWLQSFRKQPSYENPYAQSITEDEDNTVDTVYSWASSAQLTEAAKSNRFGLKEGK